MKIALIGNPNSGKTSLFNKITGSSEYVGNWPGVTIDKKIGTLKQAPEISLIDLPGIYSLSPYSPEEIITRDFLIQECPDLILNIVDASNMERNLYLSTQLLDLGIPLVIALNMMDIVEKNSDSIDTQKLALLIGAPVINTSAIKNKGTQELTTHIIGNNIQAPTAHTIFQGKALQTIEHIVKLLPKTQENKQFIAIKLFERDEKFRAQLALSSDIEKQIENLILDCEKEYDDDAESIIINQRYQYVEKITAQVLVKKERLHSFSHKIDSLLTHKYLALPLFGLIIWAIYYISISSLGALATDFTNDVIFGTYITEGLQYLLSQAHAAPWLESLLVEGVIGGVGAVLGFTPQLFILFFFLSLLEDSGYMSRVAFIMDRIFRKFGLSGTSFIPILISSGCGVPGIMASRTIENERERKITIMVSTFIPCGAKIPIIALIAGAFFPESSLVVPSIYFMSIGMIALSGIILKKTCLFNQEKSSFLMELPPYHLPLLRNILKYVWDRTKSFVVKAGTLIFVASSMIWFLSNFNFILQMVPSPESMLATLGDLIAPLFAPLGFGSWQASVATITGFLAKENVVATLGVLMGIESLDDNATSLMVKMPLLFEPIGAYAFLVFNMLCAPCFAAIGAIKREMVTLKWTFITIVYQTSLAYIISFIVYQLGIILLEDAPIKMMSIIAFLLIALLLWLTFRPYPRSLLTKTTSPSITK